MRRVAYIVLAVILLRLFQDVPGACTDAGGNP